MPLDPTLIPTTGLPDGPFLAMGLLSLDGSLFVQLGLFLLLMAVLNRLLFKPTLETVTLRERRTAGAREEAAEARQSAEDKIADFHQRMKDAREEAALERQGLREEGAGRRQELVDAARGEADQLLQRSRDELAVATTDARKGVSAAAQGLAGQIVGRLIGKATAFALVAGASANAWAGGGVPQSNAEFLKGVAFAAINLSIFLFLFVKFGKRGTGDFLQKRQSDITQELAEAKGLRDDAQAMLNEYAAKLEGLDDDRAKLKAELRAEGEADKARLIQEGQTQAERLLADAKRTIDQEVRRVQLEIQGEVLEEALSLATGRLKAETGDAQQHGLVDDFLGRVRELDAAEAR